MSAFIYYEGTSDYLAATPALVITLAASGSITAGRGVATETENPGYVYQPAAGTQSGALSPAGVALATCADGDPVPVLVFGYAKSLPMLPTGTSFPFGRPLVITGSGFWGTSGSGPSSYTAGKIVSGSAGYGYALINCMSNSW